MAIFLNMTSAIPHTHLFKPPHQYGTVTITAVRLRENIQSIGRSVHAPMMMSQSQLTLQSDCNVISELLA